MNCQICQQPMEVHQIKTTFDQERQEFQRTGYRCRQDNVWGNIEIPKSLLPEAKRIERVAQ
jgi:hypothetical protein